MCDEFMCMVGLDHLWQIHGAPTPWRIHAWLLHLCNVTHLCTAHSCMRRDTFMHGLFMCAAWLVDACDVTHWCVRHELHVAHFNDHIYIVSSLFVAEACMKNTHIMNINEWSQSCSVNDWEFVIMLSIHTSYKWMSHISTTGYNGVESANVMRITVILTRK